MNGISQFFNAALNGLSGISFDLLALVDLCAFGGVFLFSLVACALSKKIRGADKRPFLHLVNLFAAVTLALFCTRYTAAQSVIAASAFWLAGYLLYGVLCACTKKPKRSAEETGGIIPQPTPRPPRSDYASAAPAAANGVRLDHALSIADKLLMKQLGRGDRQELEKIKTALTVLKVKGTLAPQDGDTLNDTFNTLLKLMAKYDL